MRIRLHDKEFQSFISHEQIQTRLDELCAQLNSDYRDRKPLFIAILNGSFMLAADVVRRMEMVCELTFIKLKSYDGLASTGVVKTALGLEMDIEGRDVVLLEDIVDSGNTLTQFLPTLQALRPRSVAILTLLLKPDALQNPNLPLDYVGFEVENKFLVGYGLDYDNLGRQYGSIYQLV